MNYGLGIRNTRCKRILSGVFLATIITALVLYPVPSDAASHRGLQEQIDEKNKELEGLSSQIRQTQGTIGNLQGQGATLERAIKVLDTQIDQASYGIRTSEVNIDKLGLELQSLGYDLEEVTQEIDIKEIAVSEILRQVQRKDDEGFLEILLRNETLADSIFEIQTLQSLQSSLSLSVAQLSGLQYRLQGNIESTAFKRNDLEDENLTLKTRKVILGDQQEEKDRVLRETENEEVLYQTRLAKLLSEQRAILDEISDIEEQLRARFDPSSVPGRRPGLFAWPLGLNGGTENGIVTQNYGETAYATRFYKGKPHNGIDIGAPLGTKIYAAADGVVERVDYNGWYYQYGRYILINHGNNITTMYAHLSRSAVSSGQVVKRGQLIGYVGNTGFSTGSHLHFGAYATPPGGWREVSSRLEGGLVSIPPAAGLVPIGVTLNPRDYL